MKASITINIDTNDIETIDDSALAAIWHVAQANPADPFEDRDAGQIAESIGREIIRRFLKRTEPELWRHQSGHYTWSQLHLKAKEREA